MRILKNTAPVKWIGAAALAAAIGALLTHGAMAQNVKREIEYTVKSQLHRNGEPRGECTFSRRLRVIGNHAYINVVSASCGDGEPDAGKEDQGWVVDVSGEEVVEEYDCHQERDAERAIITTTCTNGEITERNAPFKLRPEFQDSSTVRKQFSRLTDDAFSYREQQRTTRPNGDVTEIVRHLHIEIDGDTCRVIENGSSLTIKSKVSSFEDGDELVDQHCSIIK